MRRLIILACLLLAPHELRAGTMGFLHYRWRNDEVRTWRVGHEEVPNQEKGDVVAGCATQYYGWSNHLIGSQKNFTIANDGDRYYDVDDPDDVIWWEQMPAGECALAHARFELDPISMNTRIKKVHVQFTTRLDPSNQCTGYPEYYGDYCWYHCPSPGPSNCAPEKTFDWTSTLAHEFGHALVGLGHYSPCNFWESVMWPYASHSCEMHRDPGTMDQSWSEWTLRDLIGDMYEPLNDSVMDAPNLGDGVLGAPPQMLIQEGYLPAYADVDFWRFDVTGSSPGAGHRLEIVIVCYDPSMRLKARIYQAWNAHQDLEANAVGQDLVYDQPAENTTYHVGVTTTNAMGGSHGAHYGIVAQLYRPVCDLPEGENAGSELAVIHHRREVRGVGTGVLELYDAGGRLIHPQDVRGRWTVSYADLRLSSGVYFLRMVAREGITKSRMVVVK